MLTGQGLRVARRGRGEPLTRETQIYLADTLGELGLFYRLARIAFIGGSLVAKGGHNPFEAARLECAVLHGPDMSNCAAMAGLLGVGGAARNPRGGGAASAAGGPPLFPSPPRPPGAAPPRPPPPGRVPTFCGGG